MQDFAKESIESLKKSGKLLIKEIEKKVALNNNKNTIDAVKSLKEYTHQVLWFLISYVAVEEYILICKWLCKLTGYLDNVAGAIRNMNCTHLNDTANENCICRILYEIISKLVESIKRLHKHKREIILRKDTTTAATSAVCNCGCCTRAGTTCKCICVDKTKIQEKEDEYFTVSTKSLDNIRSTILIFYGMDKIIEKYKELGCNNGKCSCDTKPENYTECLSLFSVCCNILKDLSSMKDGTLPMAVTWLSNCLKFRGNPYSPYTCMLYSEHGKRMANYESLSTNNKTKVNSVATNYNKMIEAASQLGSIQGENALNGVKGCNITACNATTGGSTCASGDPCSCDEQQCNCTPNTPADGVFKKLCDMMCCNGKEGCGCNTPGKCESIKSFCKEVNKFTDLVKEVIKQNGAAAVPAPTPTPCTCNNGICDSCQTRRFIRLVEVYTEELKNEHECECKDFVDKIFGQLSILIKTPFRFFGIDWACPCCGFDYQSCLKDGEHCGISNVMKGWFCFKRPILIYENFNI